MQYHECTTLREQHLWLMWQREQTRADALVAAQPTVYADRRPGPRPSRRPRLSPADLYAHRERCAARARLYRRNLSASARQRVLERARALGVLPDGFDTAAFLAGGDPGPAAAHPSTHARARSLRTLIALGLPLPPGVTDDPDLLAFFCSLQLARVEGSLAADREAMLARFVASLPAAGFVRAARPALFASAVNYDDGVSIALDRSRTPTYPNGRPILAGGGFRYPSGAAATFPSSAILYPNGAPLATADGRWGSPDGLLVTYDAFIERLRRALGWLWPSAERGLGRTPPKLLRLALLELGWMAMGPSP